MIRPLVCFVFIFALIAAPLRVRSAGEASQSGVPSCALKSSLQSNRSPAIEKEAMDWARRTQADGRKNDPAATIEETVHLGNAYRCGLRSSNIALWQALRSDLKMRSREFGLPFVPPELSGTPRFHALLSDLTKRYALLYPPRRVTVAAPAAKPEVAACAAPDSPARINVAVPPAYPDMARQEGATGSAVIRVDVAPTGAVAGESVLHSTGNAALDQASLQAARRTSYIPAYHNCHPVAGTYFFQSDFTGQ